MGLYAAVLMVAIVCVTIVQVIRMSLRHAENIKRIEHGYPTLDGSGRERIGEGPAFREVERIQ